MPITDEDILKELENNLITDEDIERENAPKKEFTAQAEMESGIGDVGTTVGEGLAAGFVKGVPFLQKGVAAVEAMKEQWDSGKEWNFEALTDSYENILADQDAAMAVAQREAPISSFAGEMAGALSTAPITGPGFKGAAAIGALEGVSQSRADSAGEYAQDIATGAGLGLVGEGIGRGIAKGLKKGAEAVSSSIKKWGDQGAIEMLGVNNRSAKKAFFKKMSRENRDISDFVDNIEKKTGPLGDISDDSLQIFNRVKNAKKEVGEDIGRFYHQEMKNVPKLNVNDIKMELNNNLIDPMLRNGTPDTQTMALKLQAYINDSFTEVSEIISETTEEGMLKPTIKRVPKNEMTIGELHDMVKRVSREADTAFKRDSKSVVSVVDQTYAENKKKLAKNLRNYLESKVDDAGSHLDKKEFNKVRKMNRDFTDLSFVEEHLSTDAAEEFSGSVISKFRDSIQDYIMSIRGAGTLLAGAAVGAATGSMGMVALPVVMGLATTPRAFTYLSRRANKLQTILATGHKVAGPAKRAFNKIAVASTLSSHEFNKQINASVAEYSLLTEPIPRDVRSIDNNMKDDISNYLKAYDSDLNTTFQKAMESGDEDVLGGVLDKMSKIEGAQAFFQKGVGFNGKVYSMEDKVALLKQLNSVTNMPEVQKLQMEHNLMKDGMIPKLDEITPREPKMTQRQPKFQKPY